MTEQQKDFVHMYLKHRDKIVAHNLAYGNNPNYDSVESSANRLLRIPEIAETIRSIQDVIRHEVEEEFRAKYREELMSIYEKRLLLKKIATGELYVEQKYKGKNCTQCSQYISPTINQMLAAIREDNKLAGHHPFKQNGKWVIPALQTEQVKETELSPAGGGVSLQADGGGTLAQETPPEKENKRQQTDASPLGRGWGGSTREEQETPDENTTPEKDPSERMFIRAGNKRQQIEVLSPAGGGVSQAADGGGTLAQETPPEKEKIGQHPEETHIDIQPLTETNTDSISLPGACPEEFREGIGGQTSLETSVNSSGQIISKEKLDELLYPNRKKRDLNNNHQQKTTIMETETGE